MVKALAWIAVLCGVIGCVLAGFLLYAAVSDWMARCPGAEECETALSVVVLAGCGLIASAVLTFGGLVFVRR